MTKYFFYLVILIFSIACNKSSIQEVEKLNIAYAKSFACPFDKVKILVQEDVGVCGNTSDDEMASLYFPTLYENPIFSIIQSNSKIDTIVHNNNFENDSTKTYVEIIGNTQNKVDTVFITENFTLNHKSIKIEKIATYKNDNWDIKTLKQETFN